MTERITPLSFDILPYLALLHAEIARFTPQLRGIVTVALILPQRGVPRYRDALPFGARTFLSDAISIRAAILTCFF